MTLLEVDGLCKSYPRRRNIFGAVTDRVQAVSDVCFSLEEGRTLAIVGESGAGKSTVGRLILRLIEPDEGVIRLDGVDLRALGPEALRRHRRHMQMVFQDPHSSLDPRMSIADSIAEPLLVHLGLGRQQCRARAFELLHKVGLDESLADRRPTGLSGGQLQRVAIARALTLNPRLIVCDEPVAALDLSVRAQVLNLLMALQDELKLAYVFISHDLSIVRAIADTVAVMSKGRIVETGDTESIFARPQHDYTKELIRSIPHATMAGQACSDAVSERLPATQISI